MQDFIKFLTEASEGGMSISNWLLMKIYAKQTAKSPEVASGALKKQKEVEGKLREEIRKQKEVEKELRKENEELNNFIDSDPDPDYEVVMKNFVTLQLAVIETAKSLQSENLLNGLVGETMESIMYAFLEEDDIEKIKAGL